MLITLSKTICLCTLMFLFLAGCAAPEGNFQTKRDPAYHRTLDRVLIVSFNEDFASRLGRDFSNRLLARITQSLFQKGATTAIVHQNKDDLDPTAAVKAEAAQFQPKQLLYVSVNRVLSRNEAHPATFNSLPSFASEVSIGIAFSVVDGQSGKTVWRGELLFDSVPSPEEVADQLVKQLEKEQFF